MTTTLGAARLSRSAVAVAVILGLLVGALSSVQSRVMGEFAVRIDDGFTTAFISMFSGFAIVAVAVAFAPQARRGLRVVVGELRNRRLPFWYAGGGAAGALFVLTQGLTVGALGVALFTVAVVCGQTLSGLILDRLAMRSAPARPFTAPRVLGSALTLVAVLIAVSSQLQGGFAVWLLVLPVIAGAGAGWQQAVNGEIRAVAASPLAATMVNFIGGVVLLGVIFAVHALTTGLPESLPSEWWLYLAGPIGVLFIGATAILVRQIGVLLLGLALIAGQLVGALALDLFYPGTGAVVDAATVAGTVLTIIAVAIAAIPTRKERAAARS